MKYGRNLEFVLCLDTFGQFGQIFESLLLTEFTMALSETYIDETMAIDPQSNMAGIWNLSSVWTHLDNLDKSLNRYSSLNLQWIFLKLILIKVWIQALNQIRPKFGICPLFGQIWTIWTKLCIATPHSVCNGSL